MMAINSPRRRRSSTAHWARILDLPVGIHLFELDFDQLLQYGSETIAFQALPRYPSIVRDFAIVVKEDLPSSRILDFITGLQVEFVQEVRVFDQYVGAPIPNQHKSLGYRITYRSPERTLTEGEIEDVHQKIIKKMLKAFGGQLRV
jgi:phenylalanyl-tRNA synthetase beta chain